MGDERNGTPLPDGPWVAPVAKEKKSKREGKRNNGKKEEEKRKMEMCTYSRKKQSCKASANG